MWVEEPFVCVLGGAMSSFPGFYIDTYVDFVSPCLHDRQSPIGGKIVVCQSSLPNVGVGVLKLREDVKLLGTPKESTLLSASSPFYKTFAVDCSRSQVSVDMFLFGSQYSDFATMSVYHLVYSFRA
ncbi:hypothetical protein BC938DRAFT_471858 [Jimgerdemannia flammicorona]|uniref:Sec23/Sec24 trunk domain-containing protein n=1 Tax=Jimgerdemannia flammicorona TaxID=994334 RepID=A0A433Q772_9FUNG|nr:hypothetical protein BC938DRAFT_471858 [Jimgerdemannia flammicorona]